VARSGWVSHALIGNGSFNESLGSLANGFQLVPLSCNHGFSNHTLSRCTHVPSIIAHSHSHSQSTPRSAPLVHLQPAFVLCPFRCSQSISSRFIMPGDNGVSDLILDPSLTLADFRISAGAGRSIPTRDYRHFLPAVSRSFDLQVGAHAPSFSSGALANLPARGLGFRAKSKRADRIPDE
jgi:hypothetical protein